MADTKNERRADFIGPSFLTQRPARVRKLPAKRYQPPKGEK